MKWYYHENSDSIFIAEDNQDFGNDTLEVMEIGKCVERTLFELKILLLKEKGLRWIYKQLLQNKIDVNYD